LLIPEELKYTKEHEWVRLESGTATIGITDYAQGELGDIIFVEMPKVGAKVNQMQPFGVIEAVKAVTELFSPVSGEVTQINSKLEAEAGAINKDPYGQGWIIKVKVSDKAELDNLLGSDKYKELLNKQE
jgi:glycine cleavage system H protein